MRTLIAFVVGFGGGWAVRSLADSPHGVGVTLLRAGHDARERLARWLATEREHFEDLVAEARADVEPSAAQPRRQSNGAASRRPARRAPA
jgi:hypothetical protein